MSTADRHTLAEQLRLAIKASGFTAYRLAKDSGVSSPQITRFLRGERDMSLVISDKICHVLGLRFCQEDKALVPVKKSPARKPRNRK